MDNERIYDIRALKQRLRTGQITWDQYQAHLSDLPDEADEGQETDVRFIASWSARQAVDEEQAEEL